MTLEEAIKHCEEKACGNTECAAEHKQLAEWLKELQAMKSLPNPKDALLECVKDLKAQMKIETAGCSNMLAAGEWLAYDKLIKKIESL